MSTPAHAPRSVAAQASGTLVNGRAAWNGVYTQPVVVSEQSVPATSVQSGAAHASSIAATSSVTAAAKAVYVHAPASAQLWASAVALVPETSTPLHAPTSVAAHDSATSSLTGIAAAGAV